MAVSVELLDLDGVCRLLAGVVDRAKRDAGRGDADAETFVTEWVPFGGDADAERAKWKRLGKRAKWK